MRTVIKMWTRGSNEHFFVQKSAQYLHKILNVCIKVCIKIRPKKRVNATKPMLRQKHGTNTYTRGHIKRNVRLFL